MHESESAGLSSANGLTSVNGLNSANGLITSDGGRTTISYIVKCALPQGRSITKTYAGKSYRFKGQIGIAPEWEGGACGRDCQENVSACVLAHVNTSGQHINIWMDSDSPALGWGRSTNHPYQEGSFFGNIFVNFVNPPKARFCQGKDFDYGVVPGRLGTQSGSPYTNPFNFPQATCAEYCTAANGDGYRDCAGFRHVVTVYRNFDAGTEYKVCNKSSGKCLEVSGGSKSDNAAVVQRSYSGASSQKWTITQMATGKYKVINVNSGKSVDLSGSVANNAPIVQKTYNGSANQLQCLTSLTDEPGKYKISPTSNGNLALGPTIASPYTDGPTQLRNQLTQDTQKWVISVAN